MGSYAALTIDGYELLQTKSYVDPAAISIFTERDRVALIAPREGGSLLDAERLPDTWTLSDVAERLDGERVFIAYRASAAVVADRLEAMGISLLRVRADFERRVRQRADEIAQAAEDDDVSRAALAHMLRQATFADWSDAFQELMTDDVHPAWPFRPPDSLRTEMMRFIAEETEDGSFFGLPGDARWLLRAAAEVCGSEAMIEYDISELVLSGYYEPGEQVAERALTALRRGARHWSPIVVLTEGSTDAEALDQAIRLLAPHLVGYVTLFDFHGANAAGGTGPLISAIRAFAAAGVSNRTVALFDNDTAGRAAIRSLERTRLPDSVRVLTLPELPLARQYPTVGPTGESIQDVNGRAASVELYFGEDVLRGADGELVPVDWRARDAQLGEWQGELHAKSVLQQRFADKVRRAAADPSLLETLDWVGMNLIIDLVLHAFSAPEPDMPPLAAFEST